MKENYNKCLETILHHEGGYVNHPQKECTKNTVAQKT
jgi:lysozyme family protein